MAIKADASQENIHQLRNHVSTSFSDIIKMAEQRAKNSSWLPDVNLPNTESLKVARERASQESVEPEPSKPSLVSTFAPLKESQSIPVPQQQLSPSRKLI